MQIFNIKDFYFLFIKFFLIMDGGAEYDENL